MEFLEFFVKIICFFIAQIVLINHNINITKLDWWIINMGLVVGASI